MIEAKFPKYTTPEAVGSGGFAMSAPDGGPEFGSDLVPSSALSPFRLGMPHMSAEGACRGWLLREACHIHWNRIAGQIGAFPTELLRIVTDASFTRPDPDGGFFDRLCVDPGAQVAWLPQGNSDASTNGVPFLGIANEDTDEDNNDQIVTWLKKFSNWKDLATYSGKQGEELHKFADGKRKKK